MNSSKKTPDVFLRKQSQVGIRTANIIKEDRERFEKVAVQQLADKIINENDIGFTKTLTAQQKRTKQLFEETKARKEFVLRFLCENVYRSLPIDSDIKVGYKEDIYQQVKDKFNNNPDLAIKLTDVGTCRNLNFGTDEIPGALAYMAKDCVRNTSPDKDHSYGRNSVTNYVDFLNNNTAEQDASQMIVYRSSNKLTEHVVETVTRRVVDEVKSLKEINSFKGFLNETKETSTTMMNHKDISRKANRTSLLNEMMVCLVKKAELTESQYTSEDILAESLLELTIEETLDVCGFKKLDKTARISEILTKGKF